MRLGALENFRIPQGKKCKADKSLYLFWFISVSFNLLYVILPISLRFNNLQPLKRSAQPQAELLP